MFLQHMRRYFIAGLLVWVPILVTIWVISFIVSLLEGAWLSLPGALRLDMWFGYRIPGFELVLSVVILFFTGMFATNYIGERLVLVWDKLVDRIPIIRSIYTSVKQVMSAIFTPNGKAFRRAVLIEYPRKGVWIVAFQAGDCPAEVSVHLPGPVLSIFVPTTPNPTSGFLILVPQEEVIILNMSVEQALKLTISLGVVQAPGSSASQAPATK